MIALIAAGLVGAAITVNDDISFAITGISTLDTTLLPCSDGTRPEMNVIEDRGVELFCGAPFGAWDPGEHKCPIAARWFTVPGGWQVVIQCEAPYVS